MIDPQNILDSFLNMAKKPEELKEVAKSRAEICAACPLLTRLKKCNKKKGGCGCWIPAKVWGKDSKCPKDKW